MHFYKYLQYNVHWKKEVFYSPLFSKVFLTSPQLFRCIYALLSSSCIYQIRLVNDLLMGKVVQQHRVFDPLYLCLQPLLSTSPFGRHVEVNHIDQAVFRTELLPYLQRSSLQPVTMLRYLDSLPSLRITFFALLSLKGLCVLPPARLCTVPEYHWIYCHTLTFYWILHIHLHIFFVILCKIVFSSFSKSSVPVLPATILAPKWNVALNGADTRRFCGAELQGGRSN